MKFRSAGQDGVRILASLDFVGVWVPGRVTEWDAPESWGLFQRVRGDGLHLESNTVEGMAGLADLAVSDQAVHVTRVDPCVTVFLDEPEPDGIDGTVLSWLRGRRVPFHNLHLSTWGETLYIYRRGQRRMWRWYDKSAQQSRGRQRGNVWRLELEARRHRRWGWPRVFLHQLMAFPNDWERARWVADCVVSQWFHPTGRGPATVMPGHWITDLLVDQGAQNLNMDFELLDEGHNFDFLDTVVIPFLRRRAWTEDQRLAVLSAMEKKETKEN